LGGCARGWLSFAYLRLSRFAHGRVSLNVLLCQSDGRRLTARVCAPSPHVWLRPLPCNTSARSPEPCQGCHQRRRSAYERRGFRDSLWGGYWAASHADHGRSRRMPADLALVRWFASPRISEVIALCAGCSGSLRWGGAVETVVASWHLTAHWPL
jgi:hypothetical protein